jgi:hypothetical protein
MPSPFAQAAADSVLANLIKLETEGRAVNTGGAWQLKAGEKPLSGAGS